MPNELWKYSATELARLIAEKSVSSYEVITSHLARIDQVNGHLNAIVQRLDDSAVAASHQADAAVQRGASLGPLHGVPFTVKTNIDVAGTATTNALVALADAIAERDAPVVERMRGAGAIPIGRTNMPEMGLRVHTDSALYGLARNPWHPHKTTGGSSGGEASALASGMSPIGLGNDIGGSLRNPAHCCGVSSIKPTAGVIPWATDIAPTSLGLASQLMLVEGVMARRVRDVRLGFNIVRGSHHRDPFSVTATLADVATMRPLRIAVCAEVPGGRTDPGISAVVTAAACELAAQGHHVDIATPPDMPRVNDMWSALMENELEVSGPLLQAVMSQDARTFLDFGREKFVKLDHQAMTLLHAQRFELAVQWSAWFQTYDVMLSPTWALPAFEHGFDVAGLTQAQEVLESFRPVLPANLFGSPVAVVPAGIANGLPVGVQVSAWRYADLKCLSVAQLIDDAMGISTPIDPVLVS